MRLGGGSSPGDGDERLRRWGRGWRRGGPTSVELPSADTTRTAGDPPRHPRTRAQPGNVKAHRGERVERVRGGDRRLGLEGGEEVVHGPLADRHPLWLGRTAARSWSAGVRDVLLGVEGHGVVDSAAACSAVASCRSARRDDRARGPRTFPPFAWSQVQRDAGAPARGDSATARESATHHRDARPCVERVERRGRPGACPTASAVSVASPPQRRPQTATGAPRWPRSLHHALHLRAGQHLRDAVHSPVAGRRLGGPPSQTATPSAEGLGRGVARRAATLSRSPPSAHQRAPRFPHLDPGWRASRDSRQEWTEVS